MRVRVRSIGRSMGRRGRRRWWWWWWWWWRWLFGGSGGDGRDGMVVNMWEIEGGGAIELRVPFGEREKERDCG